MHSYTGKTLRREGRQLKLPFALTLRGSDDVLRCERLLKIVPKRRCVLSGSWGNKRVLVKLFYRPQQVNRHLRREITGSRALSKAGVSTPDLLYAGKAQNTSIGVLLFEYLHPICLIRDLWNKMETPKEKRVLFCRLTGIVAKMHRAGLKQRDLHLNNFFIHKNKIYAIDAAQVETSMSGHPLRKKESLANLALLFAQLTVRDCALVVDLYTEYVRTRGWRDVDLTDKDLQRHIERQRKWRLKKFYTKKLFRETEKLICRRSFTHFMLCVRSDYSPVMARLLDSPERLLDGPHSRPQKKYTTSEKYSLKIENRELVVRRYHNKGLFPGFRPCFWKTRAARSWQEAHRAFALDHTIPRPIALLEKRFGPFCGTSFFIYESDSKPPSEPTLSPSIGGTA
jgi:serine/threonine protein kinase